MTITPRPYSDAEVVDPFGEPEAGPNFSNRSRTRRASTPIPPEMRAKLADPQSIRQRVEAVEAVLERSMTIPGINRKVGLDSLIGLVPVVGDIITAAMGSYLIWEGRNLGMSKFQLTRMAANIGVDTALGAVPLVGDAFDLFFRSNTKNLRIIKKHLDKHHPATRVIDG